ncbi:MAG TPA: DNA mismatch repair protein MutS [Clostridia bacterium]|nr:DNA mismatch repair protein MutS [Clostridia bacterium]
MENLTPMMKQYLKTKEQYKDCILMFRLGDFYEMFFDDALTASKELEITLTGRNCGMDDRAPMCGVPYHSVDPYIAKLIKKGYKVAICEQLEDPAQAKGIVKRDVTRIITPGTVNENTLLDEKENNYIMSLFKKGEVYSLAVSDVSTGELSSCQIIYGNTLEKLINEVVKYKPKEIISNFDTKFLKEYISVYISDVTEDIFDMPFPLISIKSKIKTNDFDIWRNACAGLYYYLVNTRKTDLSHITSVYVYEAEKYMSLDANARDNLELTENLKDNKRYGTLLWVLDKTSTSMGSRLLKKWIEQPLNDIDDINLRLDSVAELKDKYIIRQELMELLKSVYDIERLVSKTVMANANGKDLIALKNSFYKLPHIKELSSKLQSRLCNELHNDIDTFEDLCTLIDKSINEDCPIILRDGNLIKTGFDEEVDKLRKASHGGKSWIIDFEEKEKERTGIKKLRVSYNKVFGYYIEITNSFIDQVPNDYIRKQTLVNSERYITSELKKMEESILGAEEKLIRLEYEIFCRIRDTVAASAEKLLKTAYSLSVTDVLCSLSEIADRYLYNRPNMVSACEIDIKEGRHPVVERMPNCPEFIPNDLYINDTSDKTLIITGPNMAGKSTYMRQAALITVMAHIGSFVPAQSATIGITDKIFTRIGASDDLAGGKSTFMMEMSELAYILENATDRSLLILDEIGRGTSTFDGLSIAWAVIEYLNETRSLRTLFSTHYHELTVLEDKFSGVRNYFISAIKKDKDIVFLRKVKRGAANESYGIEVARLAGVPEQLIVRAGEFLMELEKSENKRTRIRKKESFMEGQVGILEFNKQDNGYQEIVEILKQCDIQKMTPLEALNLLYELKNKI